MHQRRKYCGFTRREGGLTLVTKYRRHTGARRRWRFCQILKHDALNDVICLPDTKTSLMHRL